MAGRRDARGDGARRRSSPSEGVPVTLAQMTLGRIPSLTTTLIAKAVAQK